LQQARDEAGTPFMPAPDGLRKSMRLLLPADIRAAWLRDGRQHVVPLFGVAAGLAAQPDDTTLWTPVALSQGDWQLGITFPRPPLSLHPLVAASGVVCLVGWGLLMLLWGRAGRQEYELQQVSERFRQTLEFAGDGLLVIDPDSGRIVQANVRAAALLGYSPSETLRLKLSELFAGEKRRGFHRLVRQVKRTGEGEARELLLRRRDGSTFYGAVRARLGRWGRRPMVHGVLRDVTAARLMERELRRKNQNLRLLNQVARLLAESPDLGETFQPLLELVQHAFGAEGGGIYLVRDEGKRLELAAERELSPAVTAAIRELTAQRSIIGQVVVTGQPYGAIDLTGHPLLASMAVVQHGWRSLQAVPLTAKAEIVGVLALFSRQSRRFGGEELELLQAVGHQIGTAVAWSDLYAALRWQSRLTQASNRELERSREQLRLHLGRLEETNRTLERLDRMKNNFLAIASHELRTPLTYILPSAEFLRQRLQPVLREEEQELLEAINLGGQRLDRIVHDLLEMARIESRDIYLAQERLPLDQLFTELEVEFRPSLQQRRQVLTLPVLPPGLDLHGDYYHLKKAVFRLLENAIKFTPDGGEIRVQLERRQRQELVLDQERLQPFSPPFFAAPLPSELLQLSVHDTGIGIDPQECLRIFDKFYYGGDIAEHFTSTVRFGGRGVGLGLALVKGMVEIQGGMIWVESQGVDSGEGTAFHILLPLSADGEAAGGNA